GTGLAADDIGFISQVGAAERDLPVLLRRHIGDAGAQNSVAALEQGRIVGEFFKLSAAVAVISAGEKLAALVVEEDNRADYISSPFRCILQPKIDGVGKVCQGIWRELFVFGVNITKAAIKVEPIS